MKKKMTLLLAFVVAGTLSFAACSGTDDGNDGSTDVSPQISSGGSTDTSDGPEADSGFPVSYIEFYADMVGADPADIDLDSAASVTYQIIEEGSYPTQHIRTPETVEAAVSMIKDMKVVSGPDGMAATDIGQGLGILNENGEYIITVFVQEGMVEASEGRCKVEGLDLESIPGLMDEADWAEYYDGIEEEEEEYFKNYKPSYPAPLFEVAGKRAYEFSQNATVDDILNMYVYYNSKYSAVKDRADIEKIYQALLDTKVTGEGSSSRWDDEQWSVTITYVYGDNSFEDDLYFGFHGKIYVRDASTNEEFEVDDLMRILDAYDCEQFEGVKEAIGA